MKLLLLRDGGGVARLGPGDDAAADAPDQEEGRLT
jgi:hypothetical protein